jgi:uncharacterized protein
LTEVPEVAVRTIHQLAHEGRLAQVRSILEEDSSATHKLDSFEEHPLHTACRAGRTRIAKLLLDAGADLNARGQHGMTPLHHAVRSYSPGLVRLLLEKGADASTEDDFGCTSFYFAAATGDAKMIDEFVRRRIEPDLRSAIYIRGASEVLEQLRVHPELISAGRTLQLMLWDSIRVGSSDLVAFLVENGADPNSPTWERQLPVFQAAVAGNPSVLCTLLERGGRADINDHVGRPILQASVDYHMPPEIVAVLRQYGARE